MYLTKCGNASSLQKDRETKRTPAGVAGGRLVINCKSCSASSSVGLQGEAIHTVVQFAQNFRTKISASKQVFSCKLTRLCLEFGHFHIAHSFFLSLIAVTMSSLHSEACWTNNDGMDVSESTLSIVVLYFAI